MAGVFKGVQQVQCKRGWKNRATKLSSFFLEECRGETGEITGMRDLIHFMEGNLDEKILSWFCNETLHCYCNTCNLLSEFLNVYYLSSLF